VSYERKDAHYRRAKAEGFRARSAYKLVELDDRHRLLRAGDRVADLGAWPGGWLQVALDRVGPTGRVVGVDLVAIEPLAPTAEVIVGDVRDDAVLVNRDAARDLPTSCSDVARSSGIRDTDEARSEESVTAVLKASSRLLRRDGRALIKVFMDQHRRTARHSACRARHAADASGADWLSCTSWRRSSRADRGPDNVWVCGQVEALESATTHGHDAPPHRQRKVLITLAKSPEWRHCPLDHGHTAIGASQTLGVPVWISVRDARALAAQ
jgi:23S rRNA (uridine2552-2'-O)-methyltransferase